MEAWENQVPLALEKRSESPSQFCCVVGKSCLTLCHLMDCSLPGSSVHGVFQARMLEWVASRGSSQLRGPIHVSCIAGRFYTVEPPGSPNKYNSSVLGDISLPTCHTALMKVCTKIPPHSGDSLSPLCCAYPSES